MINHTARSAESLSRDELVVAFNKQEMTRLANNERSMRFLDNKRSTDPGYMKIKAAQDVANKKARYHTDPTFRAATIARARASNLKILALKSIRHLFSEM